VVFGGSALVAYPQPDWNNGGAALIGPQTTFAAADGTMGPKMDDLINATVVGSNTNTAEALTLAYNELVAANLPGALNVIVLFTDGQPNGITANFNTNGVGNGTGGSIVKAPCVNTSVAPGNANSMLGWMAQWNGYQPGGAADTDGIFTLAQYSAGSGGSVTNWLNGSSFVKGQEPVLAPGPPTGGLGQNGAGPGKGCNFEQADPSYDTKDAKNSAAWTLNTSETTNGTLSTATKTLYKQISSDLTSFPKADYYGNATQGISAIIPGTGAGAYTQTDYKQSTIWLGTGNCNQNANDGGNPLNLTAHLGDACQFGLASWNAADMAARTIHTDAHNLKPIIYSLGFEGNGGDDPAFMQRLANCAPGVSCSGPGGAVAVNTAYWPNQPSGMYVPIATPTDISTALNTVLAEILRLAM
jgi:hypothetical protein